MRWLCWIKHRWEHIRLPSEVIPVRRRCSRCGKTQWFIDLGLSLKGLA